MNRQAFAEIEKVTIRVEERRQGVKGSGNWRVYEFTGFDAIPIRLRASFGTEEEMLNNALPLEARLKETYRQGKVAASFEAPYQILSREGTWVSVSRSLTLALRYRSQKRPEKQAA